MNTPYEAGRKSASVTDAPPSNQQLKNAGLNDTQIGEFYEGYKGSKK